MAFDSSGIWPRRYGELPDPSGRLCTGTWLTASHEFWRFSVLVPPSSSDAFVIVEEFENVTATVSTGVHERGIGKSFGALAIEVLNGVLAG